VSYTTECPKCGATIAVIEHEKRRIKALEAELARKKLWIKTFKQWAAQLARDLEEEAK